MQQNALPQCVVPYASVWLEPSETPIQDAQALFGERIQVLSVDGEFTKVRLERDGKVGWVDSVPGHFIVEPAPTHRVREVSVVGYARPHLKANTVITLPYNAQVRILERVEAGGDTFVRIAVPSAEVWVKDFLLSPLGGEGETLRDYVEEALKFLRRPYEWGGIACLPGIDCSGLVQQAHLACGIPCERDTGPQSRTLGDEVVSEGGRPAVLLRGDLVYFQGHVVIMINKDFCVHATNRAPHSGVVLQPLSEVLKEREAAGEGGITIVRRHSNYLHHR